MFPSLNQKNSDDMTLLGAVADTAQQIVTISGGSQAAGIVRRRDSCISTHDNVHDVVPFTSKARFQMRWSKITSSRPCAKLVTESQCTAVSATEMLS